MRIPINVALFVPLVLVGCGTQDANYRSMPSPAQNNVAKVLTRAELLRSPHVTCDKFAQDRQQVRARHIVVETPPSPTDAQLRAAYEKALNAKAAISDGENFERVEALYSNGASSRGVNGGDLDFFKRGVMVPEVDLIAFCIPVNEMSPVFASPFGFHILQVTAVR